ncbi:MAG TPA: L-fucose/L-arabinose isomerase family protein [Verrucomicrobiae bacterium]|nr:L-fucose/L-arabinose isomerase family protein [Verrucomicrobiae bacterium]
MKTDSKLKLPNLGVIFIGRRRPGFDMEWGRQMEQRVRNWISQAGYETVEPSSKPVDNTTLRCAMAELEDENLEAIVVLQTTMGDGRLAPTMAQLWRDPLVLWATPENQSGDMISSCSLVGAHCWASVLRQMRHSFELVYGAPEAATTQKRFHDAVRVAATVRNLRSARLGIVGGQAPGYFAMGADPFEIHHGLGAQTQSYSLLEFANVVNDLKDEAIAADVAAVKALKMPHKDTTDEDLPMASRLYLAMRHFFEAENLDAMTIRCWPEMPNTFGQWPYLGVARLCEEKRALAVEGDADGALTAWIGERLGMGRCYLTDWLEHDAETITVWHGGAAPISLCQPPGAPGAPHIARHFNIKKPAVVEATLRENMPVTIARLWRCDGKYFLTAREGTSIKPRRHLMATDGLARMKNQDPHVWFEELCHAGMPHHVALFEGHHEPVLRSFARALKIEFI